MTTKHKHEAAWLGVPYEMWKIIVGAAAAIILGYLNVSTQIDLSNHKASVREKIANLETAVDTNKEQVARVSDSVEQNKSLFAEGAQLPPITMQGGPEIPHQETREEYDAAVGPAPKGLGPDDEEVVPNREHKE